VKPAVFETFETFDTEEEAVPSTIQLGGTVAIVIRIRKLASPLLASAASRRARSRCCPLDADPGSAVVTSRLSFVSLAR
jgi:hypothetical protein